MRFTLDEFAERLKRDLPTGAYDVSMAPMDVVMAAAEASADAPAPKDEISLAQ